MPTSTTAELARLTQTLHQERRQHADAIAEIDAAFASLGITPVTVQVGLNLTVVGSKELAKDSPT